MTEITRGDLVRVISVLAPFIKAIDTEYLLHEALSGNCVETFADMRDLSKNFVNPSTATVRNSTLAFMTIVAEKRLDVVPPEINTSLNTPADMLCPPPSILQVGDNFVAGVDTGYAPPPDDIATIEEDTPTGEKTIRITHVHRNKDTKSGTPQYTVHTADGDQHWCFLRANASGKKRDTIGPFLDAGYVEIKQMAVGDRLRWKAHPITAHIQLQQGSDTFYDVIRVDTRPDGAKPDSSLLDGLTADED